jgi:hypothetical protein
MTKKSNKKIAEMREYGKEIIDNLGNEIVKDNVEISELNDEIVDNDEISKLQRDEIIDDKIEINELKNEIANNDEISKLQRDEIIDDKIEINELKDKVIEEENIIEENKAVIEKLQETKEMKIKVTENKMNKDVEENKSRKFVETKENIKENKENKMKKDVGLMGRKDISAIESKLNKLVEIKDVQINVEGLDTVYLVKVAGIDIRVYFSIIEANRLYRFMKGIIREVIINGSAKVEIKELKTNDKIYYLLKVTNKNVKIYTSIQEATRVANYMTNVLNEILKMIN